MSIASKFGSMTCAVALTVGMLAMGASGASASTDSVGDPNITDTVITISGTPTGISGQHPFNAYRVGTYKNIVVKDGVLQSVDVTTNPKYADAAKKALKATGVDSADPMAYVQQMSDPADNTKPWTSNPKLRSFADNLAADISAAGSEDGTQALQPDATFTYDDGHNQFEVDEGVWLLIDEQGIDMGASYGSLPILVSTDASNASFDPEHPLGRVNLKTQNLPTVTLTFDQRDGNGTFQRVDDPDFAIGQTFYTRTVTTLPYYTGYPLGDRTYALSIAFGEGGGEEGAGMELASDSFDVTVTSVDGSAKQTLQAGKDYQVEGGSIVTVDLANYVNGKGANKLLEGGTVTVLAKVRLNAGAVVATEQNPAGNPVTSTLIYSSTPNDLTHTAMACANAACAYGTDDNYIYAYTYGYSVAKADKSDPSKPLGGAEFDVNNDGKKDYTTAADGDAKGTFEVKGIDSGTQTVAETKAPDGYQQTALPKFSFAITPTFVSGATNQQRILQKVTYSDESGDTLDLVSHKAGASRYTVLNAKTIAQLPLTGGAGIALIMLVAVVLATLGTMRIVQARRMR